MIPAVLFSHPIDWLVHDGVGQNLTAGFLVFIAGFAWSKTKYWPLHALHVKLDALHEHHERLRASHERLHEKLDRIERKMTDG